MLKPSVGDITDMSSPLNFFSIVVFPALSKPLALGSGNKPYCLGSSYSSLPNHVIVLYLELLHKDTVLAIAFPFLFASSFSKCLANPF